MSIEQAERASAQRQCFLILGMHRSGTSAFAGLISKLGINLPNTPIMPGMPSNPYGHFEPSMVVDLHEKLLEKLGSGWADPRDLELSVEEQQSISDFQLELKRFVSAIFDGDHRIVMKDPRTCRLLPLWRSVLEEIECQIIPLLIVRNPIGVAGSLTARNQLSPGVSIALWLRHVLDAEAGTRGLPRSFVRFENLAGDWRAQIERIAEQTGADLGDRSQVEMASGFVDASAIHHVHDDREVISSGQFPAPLAQMAGEVLLAHDRLVSNPHDSSAIDMLDAVKQEFDAFTRDYGTNLFQLTEQILDAKIALQESEARTQQVKDELEHVRNTLSWQITEPLRKLGDIKRNLKGETR